MRKPYCTRERRTTLMIWAIPWILAGVVSVLLVVSSSSGNKRQVVHTRNPVNNQKTEQEEKPVEAPVNATLKPVVDIWPVDDVKTNFDWVDAEWLESNELSHPEIKVFDVEILGEVADHIKDAYRQDIPVVPARYAKVPFAYAGDCGYAIANKLPYPQTSSYLYELDALMLLSTKTATVVNDAVILPYLSRSTWPYYAVRFLPALMSLPSRIRSSCKIVITVEPPGFRDVLMNIGFRSDQIVAVQGWVKGENLYILQHPLPGQIYKWELKHFARLQQQAFRTTMYRTIGLCTTWEMTISKERMEQLEKILVQGDKRIAKMPHWTSDRISHMESFYRHNVIIGFSSNFLYYIPFMRPGSLAIVVQGGGNNLEYVSLGREMGVRVVVIGVEDMTKIPDSVCGTILDVIKKYYPDEKSQSDDADDDDK